VTGLKFGSLGPNTLHLCVDMQRLFGPQSAWYSPWTERILPAVETICGRYAERTAFTRFIPPRTPEDMPGMWRHYYRRWHEVTRREIHPDLLDLVPALRRHVPPATVFDKATYSAFSAPGFSAWLVDHHVDTLVVTGAETDVCILATVLGAVDHGYRVVIVTDAICSSSDPGHDALMELYHLRFSEQVETADTETVLAQWRR
jgi:nicotinamidase-related amidase